MKKRSKALEIVKREASVTSIRAGTNQGVVANDPAAGRRAALPSWGSKVASSRTWWICTGQRGAVRAEKRYGTG